MTITKQERRIDNVIIPAMLSEELSKGIFVPAAMQKNKNYFYTSRFHVLF